MAKPRFLILGGLGFIGRHLVEYLLKNDIASKIRIVDKTHVAMANMSKEHSAMLENPAVQVMQKSMTSPTHIQSAFADEDGQKWDFVINLAADVKYAQDDGIYDAGITEVIRQCAPVAKQVGIKRWVEMSCARVYEASDKKALKEDAPIKPWTKIATHKHHAEQEVQKILGGSSTELVILRAAIVYGPGDVLGVSPRLVIGSCYQFEEDTMEFLWDGEMMINTVHVRDVAKAAVHVCTNGANGEIYNLADKSNSTQKSIADFLVTIFPKIKAVKFKGNLMSRALASTNTTLSFATEYANEKHMKPWGDITKKYEIKNTPLTPYLDMDLLRNNDLNIDGSKIEGTGFSYDYPKMTVDLLKEQLKYSIDNGHFPAAVANM